jgi:hypothetical protein
MSQMLAIFVGPIVGGVAIWQVRPIIDQRRHISFLHPAATSDAAAFIVSTLSRSEVKLKTLPMLW